MATVRGGELPDPGRFTVLIRRMHSNVVSNHAQLGESGSARDGRDGYGSNVASFADKVCEHPVILSLLEVLNRNRRQFRPMQSTPE